MSDSEWYFNIKVGDLLYHRDTSRVWTVKEIDKKMSKYDFDVKMQMCNDPDVFVFSYSYVQFAMTFTPNNPLQDLVSDESKLKEEIELLRKEIIDLKQKLSHHSDIILNLYTDKHLLVEDVFKLRDALSDLGVGWDKSRQLLRYEYGGEDDGEVSGEDLSVDDVEIDDDP